MKIYEELTELDRDVEEMGLSPLMYVVLNCAR